MGSTTDHGVVGIGYNIGCFFAASGVYMMSIVIDPPIAKLLVLHTHATC